MEWLIFLSLLICGLMIFFIRGILEEKKKEKEFLRQLKENYGKNPDREYEFQEYEVISRYYKTRHQEGFTVDDITWEDLGMDFLYKSMNYTMSSAGDEYFYYLLRTPVFSMKELKERERLISYFMEKEEERRILQNKFHKKSLYNRLSELARKCTRGRKHRPLYGLYPSCNLLDDNGLFSLHWCAIVYWGCFL